MYISLEISSAFSICIIVFDLLEVFCDVFFVILSSLCDLAMTSAILLPNKSPVASTVLPIFLGKDKNP